MNLIMNNYTLIINYAGLSMGGIESFLSKLMQYSLRKKYRVIWLTTPMHIENPFYKELVKNKKVEKVYVGHGRTTFRKVNVNLGKKENVVMVSCEPLYFIAAEELRRRAKTNTFFHYLILPHFTGNAYYIERYFDNKFLKKLCYGFMKKLVQKWERENCILGFSPKHLDYYEKNYDVTIKDKENKVLKAIEDKFPVNIDKIKEKAQKRPISFKIISCARFDFPHKGYLIGLIEKFDFLYKKYPQLSLTIVGDGPGRQEIEKIYNNLESEVQKAIKFTGLLSREDLLTEFSLSTLNIGVAGGLLDGAKCALPSIVVRHYSYTCEAYGFLENSRDKLLSSEKGQFSIDKCIEKVIKMSNEEYEQHALLAYETAYSFKEIDPDYLFKRQNRSSIATISPIERLIGKCINYACWFEGRILGKPGYNEEEKSSR